MADLIQLLRCMPPREPGLRCRVVRVEAGAPVKFGDLVVTLLQDVDADRRPGAAYLRVEMAPAEAMVPLRPIRSGDLRLVPRAVELIGERVDALYIDCQAPAMASGQAEVSA